MLAAGGLAHAQAPDEPQPGDSSGETTAATAPDAPSPIDELTLADDLIAAVGLRPITQRRLEALVDTGTDAMHQAALRATEKRGSLGVELAGEASTSDVLGSRTEATARIEHETERDVARLTAGYGTRDIATPLQSFATDARTLTYGGAWTAWRSAGRLELEAHGAQQSLDDTRDTGTLELSSDAYSLHARVTSRRVQALGMSHELSAGIGLVQASGTAIERDLDADTSDYMSIVPSHRRGRQRFLSAYIHDTVRVIESLDVHGGFVFEHWRWLTNIPPLGSHDFGENMDGGTAEVISALFGPRLEAVLRVSPELSVDAIAYRQLRPPTWQQLMRPIQNGDVVTRPGELRAETVTGAEVGPALSTGALDARAVAYWQDVKAPIAAVTVGGSLRETTNLGRAREAGVEARASWRIAKPWLLAGSYRFAATRVTESEYAQLLGKQLAEVPRHRATALIAYDEPRIVTLTGAVRFVAARFTDDRNTQRAAPYAVVDAMATRTLTHGLAGYIAVENILDRGYVDHVAGVDTLGAPRTVHVGLRLDTARW